MKIAKIALPLSVLALIGIVLATFLFGQMATPPEDDGLAFGLSYIFLIVINMIPMIIFGIMGIGILICEVCLFAARNKFAALTAALVMMCILVPVVLFSSILLLMSLARYSAVFTVIVALSMVIYIAALIAVFISYFKARALRNKESAQDNNN